MPPWGLGSNPVLDKVRRDFQASVQNLARDARDYTLEYDEVKPQLGIGSLDEHVDIETLVSQKHHGTSPGLGAEPGTRHPRLSYLRMRTPQEFSTRHGHADA